MTRHDSPTGGPSQGDDIQGDDIRGDDIRGDDIRGDARRDEQPQRREKPSVPLEKLIEENSQRPDVEAADRLASEAAKAPTPEVEVPPRGNPEADDSVTEMIENQRRQSS